MAEHENKCLCFRLRRKKTPAEAAVLNALEVPLETAVHVMYDEVTAKLEKMGVTISPDARKKFVTWADDLITQMPPAEANPSADVISPGSQ